jgi:hypothetical protein
MKLFTNSINITFSDTGLYIQSMDTANVSMFELKIPKNGLIHTGRRDVYVRRKSVNYV